MHTTEFLSCLGEKDFPEKRSKKKELCCFCANHDGDIHAKDCFGDNFTNFDLFRNAKSGTVCDHCYKTLKNNTLRQSSWLVSNNTYHKIEREEIMPILMGEKEIPFCVYITTSFKKHGQIKAQIAYSQDFFPVLFEEIPLVFSKKTAGILHGVMRDFYSAVPDKPKKNTSKTPLFEEVERVGVPAKNAASWFTKAEMRTGEYKLSRIKEYGISKWQEKEAILAPHRGSPIFDLVLHGTNQEETK